MCITKVIEAINKKVADFNGEVSYHSPIICVLYGTQATVHFDIQDAGDGVRLIDMLGYVDKVGQITGFELIHESEGTISSYDMKYNSSQQELLLDALYDILRK